MSLNRLILSTDEDKRFFQFLPLVVAAWKKFMPELKLSLAFITDRKDDDPVIIRMKEHIDVHCFSTIEGIPTGNQAKVCRHILASYFDQDFCTIHDLDSLPLQSKFHELLLAQKESGKLMAVGAEVYAGTPNQGKFPSGHMTAEGCVFKRLFNPLNLGYRDLIKTWSYLSVFDHKEAVSKPLVVFSDESLIRALISLSKTHQKRQLKAY